MRRSSIALVSGFVLALTAAPLDARASGILAPGKTLVLTDLTAPVLPDDTAEDCFAFSLGTCGTDPVGERFGARTTAVTSFSRGQGFVSHFYDFDFDDGGLYDNVLAAQISGRTALNGFLALVGGGEAQASLVMKVHDLGPTSQPSQDDGTVIHEETLARHALQGVAITGLNFGITVEGGAPYIGVGASPELKFNVQLQKKVVRDTIEFGTQVLLRRGHSYRLELRLNTMAKKGAVNGLSISQFRLGGPVTDMLDLENWVDGVMDTIAPGLPAIRPETIQLKRGGLLPELAADVETLDGSPTFNDTRQLISAVGPSAGLPTSFLEIVEQRFRNRLPPVLEEELLLAGVEIEELAVTAADDQAEIVGLWEIERHLARCGRFVSLFQPQEYGGKLEIVSALVKRLIAQSDAMGGRTDGASRLVAQADAAYGEGRFKRSYRRLCIAYRALARQSL